jgi:hypothetical protein
VSIRSGDHFIKKQNGIFPEMLSAVSGARLTDRLSCDEVHEGEVALWSVSETAEEP